MAAFECCYKCTDRVIGCHGLCKRYLAAKQKQNDFNNYRAKNKISYSPMHLPWKPRRKGGEDDDGE